MRKAQIMVSQCRWHAPQLKSISPHAQLVEAVLKYVVPSHSDAQGAIVAVLIARGADARAEKGALVVKIDQAGHLQQGGHRRLQQAGVVPEQGVQQAPVFLSKPAAQLQRAGVNSRPRKGLLLPVVPTTAPVEIAPTGRLHGPAGQHALRAHTCKAVRQLSSIQAQALNAQHCSKLPVASQHTITDRNAEVSPSVTSGMTAWARWQAGLSAMACTRPILGCWHAALSATVSHLRKGNLGSACACAGGPLGPPCADCRLLLGPETSMEAAKGRAPRSKETWRDTALSSGGWWAVQTSHSTKKASTRGMTCGTQHQCPAGVVEGGPCTPNKTRAIHLRHGLHQHFQIGGMSAA